MGLFYLVFNNSQLSILSEVHGLKRVTEIIKIGTEKHIRKKIAGITQR